MKLHTFAVIVLLILFGQSGLMVAFAIHRRMLLDTAEREAGRYPGAVAVSCQSTEFWRASWDAVCVVHAVSGADPVLRCNAERCEEAQR